MYKALLFDMDGTLVDTFDLIHSSFNKALEENGKRTLTKGEFKERLFGKPVDSTLPEILGVESKEEVKRILKSFEIYWLRDLKNVKVFKNVFITLQRLKDKGCKLGVVSTSPRDVIEETLRETSIYPFFDIIIGEEDVKRKKPHKEPVASALKLLGVRPDGAAFVGDTIYDMQAAKSAGCETILMLNGHNKDVLDSFKPDRVIGDIEELL
jgi:pyrophosphatase PpaX